MQDRKLALASPLLAAFALAGCGGNPSRQETGTIAGAATGAYPGNPIGRQLEH